MKFIIKLFPEITIKSKSVRQRMCKVLQGNIRNVLRRVGVEARVRNDWDKMVVSCDDGDAKLHAAVVECLKCTPGIQQILRITSYNVCYTKLLRCFFVLLLSFSEMDVLRNNFV